MTWTELIEAFAPRLPDTIPPLTVDRVPQDYRRKKYNKILNSVGSLGRLGMVALDLRDMPLQKGEPFFTRIRCDIRLPKMQQLTMVPREETSGQEPRWKVKTDLPKQVTDELTALLTDAARDGIPPLRLVLTPLEEEPSGGEVTHRLCASTGIFRDRVDNLCAALDWHPTAPDGRPLSSPEAAELILQRMAELCQGARDVLTGR